MVKRKRRRDPDDADEPLGKLLQEHEVSLAGVLVVSGAMGLVGAGVFGSALLYKPPSLTLMLAGAGVLVLALVVLATNAFNAGRRLELRKHGVRFTEAGVTTEMLWDEIAAVEVSRTDDTYLGAATVRRESADTASPSGLLTNTEWDVTLRGRDGRTIRLPPSFLRTVPDARELVGRLKMRAGVE